MTNVRRNLAVQLTAGGPNPLKLRLNGRLPYTKGTAVNASLVVQGGTPGYAYSITAGALPTGLSLNAGTGAITGTPSAAGTFNFTAQVQDGASTVYQSSFTMVIQHILQPLTVVPTPMEAGAAYTFTFQVSGNTGAVTWALTSGAFPSSISISSAGVLSGTASSPAGIYNAVVTASDAGTGDTLPIQVSINLLDSINFGGPAPASITLYTGVAYTLIPLQAGIFGGLPPYRYTFTSKPSWATFDPNTRTFYGTPDTTGFVTITVNVSDALGGTGSVLCSFTVINPNRKIQPQKAGSNVGSAGPSTLNYDGIGAAAVVNDGNTATITLGANMNKPPGDVTIPPDSTAVVVRKLTIASGKKLTIGLGAILRID